MTIWNSIRQAVEGLMNSARISSASPNYVNRVEGYDWFSETADFEEFIRTEIRRIIDETKTESDKENAQSSIGTPRAEDSEGTNVEATIRTGVHRGVTTLQNPIPALAGAVRGIPIPHAQLVLLALAMAPIMFELLTRDGGALDLRWRRKMLKEQNSFLDRQTQRNTQIGTRQVIIQSRAGFIQMNGGAGNENNIRQIRDGGVDGNRLSMIDMTDHAKELFSP